MAVVLNLSLTTEGSSRIMKAACIVLNMISCKQSKWPRIERRIIFPTKKMMEDVIAYRVSQQRIMMNQNNNRLLCLINLLIEQVLHALCRPCPGFRIHSVSRGAIKFGLIYRRPVTGSVSTCRPRPVSLSQADSEGSGSSGIVSRSMLRRAMKRIRGT